MGAIVVAGDALDPASLDKAFGSIEEVDAVISTVGGTSANPKVDGEVRMHPARRIGGATDQLVRECTSTSCSWASQPACSKSCGQQLLKRLPHLPAAYCLAPLSASSPLGRCEQLGVPGAWARQAVSGAIL